MAYKKDPDELVIWDDKSQIIFHCGHCKYGDSYWDENYEYWIDESDGNQIEINFREDEEDGWGVGGGEYVSTADIKSMADCIRSVINKEQVSASYTCQDDLFRIEISCNETEDTYTFSVAMLEILMRDHHISITKTGLTRSELDEYIEPFFIWEQIFPIIGGNGIIYKKTRDERYVEQPKPFCKEPIIKTHHMKFGIGDEEMWEQIDYSKNCELVYNAMPGFWLVLETEHNYISIGTDGIKKYETLEQLKGENRQVWNDPVTGVEEVVLLGEHIRSFDDWKNGWEIVFDHFHMTVVPHEMGDGFEGTAYQVDKPFYGFKHVLNKCVCGGQPEFMMDRHSDFYVECPVCKRYTYATYDAAVPVSEWNGGEIHCIPGNESIKADLTRVFIHLDGVLADVSRGIEELCHLEPNLLKEDADNDQVWDAIKKVEHFFGKLDFVPGSKELFDLIYARYGDRCEIIASLPMPQRKIVARPDIMDWVHHNLGENLKIHYTSGKGDYIFCKGQDYVLIDTKPERLYDWARAGGQGIWFTDARKAIAELQDKGLL